MKLISSYAAQLKNLDFNIMDTVKIYREAVSFCIDAFNKEWDDISAIKDANEQNHFAERLIHKTKSNTPKYDFDTRYYKFPSYLRRGVIRAALGCVSSYKSNWENWNKNKTGEEPTLTMDRNIMPVFYYKNMYLTSDDPYQSEIKVYINNDWVWRKVQFVKTDVKYLNKYWSHVTASAPVLEKRFGTYYLRFAFEENVKLYDTNITNQVICSVDLGLNSDAVCTIMTSDGTIHARKFINFASDKDQLWHLCNRLKKKQRKYGPRSVKSMWRYDTHLNDELSVKIATAIVEFAELWNTDTIVFEYLDMKGKKNRGKNAQRLHLWRKNGIQELVTHKAHKRHMHISRICAWGTSKLAYDGNGEVIRDKNNRALATFQNGKQYNCDLSASYNIGARYFIRELLKPVAEKWRSQLVAKVPEAGRRTSCTYSTLLALNSAIAELSKAA